jgi:hypothetical protein
LKGRKQKQKKAVSPFVCLGSHSYTHKKEISYFSHLPTIPHIFFTGGIFLLISIYSLVKSIHISRITKKKKEDNNRTMKAKKGHPALKTKTKN